MAANLTTIFTPETDEEIYRRLAEDFGNPPNGVWNLREGSQVYTWLKPLVQEHQRFKDFAEFVTSLGFLETSQGPWLDAKAAEYGVTRDVAVAAKLTMTFVGDVGTVIPAGTVVSTESSEEQFDGIYFTTDVEAIIGVSGNVQVTATAQVPGVDGNVGAGDVTIIQSSISGLEAAYNETVGSGGLDVQDNESLRSEALFRAASLPQAGNKATYAIIALDDPEVETVYVEDFWDQTNGLGGNGTTRVVVGGGLTPYVSITAVERLQIQMDPTIKNIAFFEDEVWTGSSVEDASSPIEGKASRSLSAPASTTTTMTLAKTLQLGDFDDDVNDEVWLAIRRISGSATLGTNALKITFFVPGGTGVAKAEATITGATLNTLTNITDEALLKVVKGSFVITNGTGTFSWDNIAGVTLSLTASASGTATVTFDGMRIRRAKGGFPNGEATLGTQITVRSARAKAVTVSANIELQTGLEAADVVTIISDNIRNYLDNVTPGTTVRLSEIGNAIHDADGVIDYNTILINGSAANLTLTSDQRPILGADPVLTIV